MDDPSHVTARGRLGILGAMPQEIASLRPLLEDVTVERRGDRQVVLGRLHGREVVVMHSRIGKVAAAIAATELVTVFGAERIVFTGVAGRLDPELRVGDVVVATALLQHDLDARPLFPRYEVPLAGRARFETDAGLRRAAAEAAARFTADVGAHVPEAARVRLRLARPRVVEGLIASGDRFLASDADVAELRARLPEARCVEMEGAAVAQVCHELGTPFVVVRTISDGADDAAAADFWPALEAIAGPYSAGIVGGMVDAGGV